MQAVTEGTRLYKGRNGPTERTDKARGRRGAMSPAQTRVEENSPHGTDLDVLQGSAGTHKPRTRVPKDLKHGLFPGPSPSE